MTYPSSGQPYYPGQPEQNQPQYGGYPATPGADPNAGGTYGYDSAYPQPESYTTEPPMSGQPMSGQPMSGQPYSGQPYSGAPYDQGAYGQPGHDPAYGGDPAYGAAPGGYPQGYQQQPPSFVAQPVPQQGMRGSAIALIVGLVVVVLLVLGIGGVVLLRSGNDEPTAGPAVSGSAAPSDSTAPSEESSPSAASGGGSDEYPARIDLPQTVAGLTKVDNAELNKTANDTALQIKNETDADSAIAAYYAPAGDMTRAVGLIGATGRITDPEGELDDAFAGDLAVSSTQPVDPGPLGGDMRCGNTASGGQTMTVCGWADGGSLALGIFINRSLSDSAALFRQIRGEVLKRG